jgi:mannose-6-phosphate isomerase-like protein (cupin superfamily)
MPIVHKRRSKKAVILGMSAQHGEETINMKGIVVPPDQGPAMDHMSPGRSVVLKLLSGQTDESLMMFEEATPAGTGTSMHLHHDSDEVTYVLSGEFTFKIGEEITVGGPGTCAFMPRGVPHAWKNTGAEPGKALFIYTPAGAGKLFEELKQAQRSLASMGAAELTEFFRSHHWEIVGPSPF